MARKAGLAAIAITDHDTVAGIRQIIENGPLSDIRFLTGIEISAASPPDIPCQGGVHMLGYGFAPDDPGLNQVLAVLQKSRQDRYPKIIERLNHLGINITVQELMHYVKTPSQVGRPQIAQCLVARGEVVSIDDAFNQYLGKGRPAFVSKYRISCQEAIDAIQKAGGVSVLAHPGLLELPDGVDIDQVVERLSSQGLIGIEVEYPGHTPDQKRHYKDLARRFGLIETGGSDFHGSARPDISMGKGNGNLAVPFQYYETLIQRLS